MDHPFKEAYNNRLYGIYIHGLNRFILIDSDDIWVTLQTAQALSSKAVTSVCVLPEGLSGISNENCLFYTVVNEKEGIGAFSSVLRQSPCVKIYNQVDSIKEVGHIDLEDPSILRKMKIYVDYIHRVSYALSFVEAMFVMYSNKRFAEAFVLADLLLDLELRNDKTVSVNGLFNEIRHVLYMSDQVEKVREEISQLFANCYPGQKDLILQFYDCLNEPLPENLGFIKGLYR